LITHNKVTVIDDAAVFAGSLNFTAMAQKFNAENKLVLNNRTWRGSVGRTGSAGAALP
jgi:phosphatidylserine/phosphatidylglycerophosphate/cardiolipin synthase-like enzyme